MPCRFRAEVQVAERNQPPGCNREWSKLCGYVKVLIELKGFSSLLPAASLSRCTFEADWQRSRAESQLTLRISLFFCYRGRPQEVNRRDQRLSIIKPHTWIDSELFARRSLLIFHVSLHLAFFVRVTARAKTNEPGAQPKRLGWSERLQRWKKTTKWSLRSTAVAAEGKWEKREMKN